MPSHRYTYLILLLCTAHLTVCAKPHYVFQSENPIADFAWDENDTSRYKQAYLEMENMLNGKTLLSIKRAVFLHRTDWNGKANHSSKGCMIIDGRQWRNVETQLKKSSNNFFESHQNYSKEEVLKARDEIENNIWRNNREIPAN